jgi:AAA domain
VFDPHFEPIPPEDINPLHQAYLSDVLRALDACGDALDENGGPAAFEAIESPADQIETLAEFLREPDPPGEDIFPDLLRHSEKLLLHGDPRAKKSLIAWELACSAATGTAPFGLTRFQPLEAVTTVYVQEEDPRTLTRKRLRALVAARFGDAVPERLHVYVRRGLNLDDATCVTRLMHHLRRLDAKLLVLDAARRLSAKTDEGPAKVREFTEVLRWIGLKAGVAIIVVHHDVKPSRQDDDVRRRGHRASGGDWFAAFECPLSVERLDLVTSVVIPQDYKFSADPDPFTIRLVLDGKLVVGMVGETLTPAEAETAGARGKVLDWLRSHGPATKTALKRAGFGWASLSPILEALIATGYVDSSPGRRRGSVHYFARPQVPSSPSQDGRPTETEELL